ncbi:hypothetical protein Ddc_19337 [Ditylenchus destructor]|nr:hypothetical protein Ddc_19337 [Ditylenchus destructor]
MEKLSQEILSIAHLWANGRVVADLFKYSEYDNKILPLSDFCDALFNQERSILKCKELGVSLDSCWPMSIVTNAARHCSKLILKETGYCDKRLHFRLLDALYDGKLPQQVAVTFELLITRNTNEFIDELKKHFQRSTELNFKLILFTPKYCAPPDMLLRNEHGLTLTTKTLSQDKEQRDRVTIEQRNDS